MRFSENYVIYRSDVLFNVERRGFQPKKSFFLKLRKVYELAIIIKIESFLFCKLNLFSKYFLNTSKIFQRDSFSLESELNEEMECSYRMQKSNFKNLINCQSKTFP